MNYICIRFLLLLYLKEIIDKSELNGKSLYSRCNSEVGLNLLKEHFEVEMYEGEGIIDKATLMEGVKDASALISILSTNVDQEVIDSASNLKIIANYGAGFNNVDVKYAREKILM